MSKMDLCLIWVGAVPALLFGVGALLAGQLAIALGNLVIATVTFAVAFWPENSNPTH